MDEDIYFLTITVAGSLHEYALR